MLMVYGKTTVFTILVHTTGCCSTTHLNCVVVNLHEVLCVPTDVCVQGPLPHFPEQWYVIVWLARCIHFRFCYPLQLTIRHKSGSKQYIGTIICPDFYEVCQVITHRFAYNHCVTHAHNDFEMHA